MGGKYRSDPSMAFAATLQAFVAQPGMSKAYAMMGHFSTLFVIERTLQLLNTDSSLSTPTPPTAEGKAGTATTSVPLLGAANVNVAAQLLRAVQCYKRAIANVTPISHPDVASSSSSSQPSQSSSTPMGSVDEEAIAGLICFYLEKGAAATSESPMTGDKGTDLSRGKVSATAAYESAVTVLQNYKKTTARGSGWVNVALGRAYEGIGQYDMAASCYQVS